MKAVVSVVIAALLHCALGPVRGVEAAVVYALTDDNRLLRFDSATPGTLIDAAPIGGRIANEDLIGIDFRQPHGAMYAVGEFGTIYTIDPQTAAASVAGALVADPADPTDPFTQLRGSRFGFDFDPSADVLRITSDARQNLRVNVGSGRVRTEADFTRGIAGAAYRINVSHGAVVFLFGIDAMAGQHRLVLLNPTTGTVLEDVGPLGPGFASLVGFDVITPFTNPSFPFEAYAALYDESAGVSQLYHVNTENAATNLIGTIGGGDRIDGLAILVPEPSVVCVLALGALAVLRRP